jgi:hypothetical protein
MVESEWMSNGTIPPVVKFLHSWPSEYSGGCDWHIETRSSAEMLQCSIGVGSMWFHCDWRAVVRVCFAKVRSCTCEKRADCGALERHFLLVMVEDLYVLFKKK